MQTIKQTRQCGSVRRVSLKSLVVVTMLLCVSVTQVIAQNSQATLVVINFVGEELMFTINDETYLVPGIDTVPDGGKLTLALAPGRYTFTGHVPCCAGGNGEIELMAGQTRFLGIRVEWSGPIISSTGSLLEGPDDRLVFFEANLTPPEPTPTPELKPVESPPDGLGALVIVNYIGEVLAIDIDSVLYTISPIIRK